GQERAADDGLENLRVDLDARQSAAEGRRPDVFEPDGRGSNQDELARDPRRIGRAIENVLRGDVDVLLRGGVAHPDAANLVGGDRVVAYHDRVNHALKGLDHVDGLARGDAQ